MSNLAQNLNTSGVVTVEPVILRPGHSFADLREAMSLFSQTLKKYKIASGFLGSFVVLDNPEPTDDADTDTASNHVVLLSFFWASQGAIDLSGDNPLYQVLLDDVLSHCLSPEGERLRAPGLVTDTFEPGQVSGFGKQAADVHGNGQQSHAIH